VLVETTAYQRDGVFIESETQQAILMQRCDQWAYSQPLQHMVTPVEWKCIFATN